MVDFIQLVNAMVDKLRLIPEVITILGDPAAISAYIDMTPTESNAENDTYKLAEGVRVYYRSTDRDTPAEMEWWAHHVDIVIKAPDGASNMDLAGKIVNGIPVPGDGKKWWICPLFEGLNPTEIQEVGRITDPESVDYFLISTKITETGDL